MQPPVAHQRPTSTEIHGRTRIDDYEWLRDKDSPEVTAYLEAENAYTQERTAHLADLRQTIFEEIKARTLETDLSVPDPDPRALVLRPLLRGQGVRRQLPRPGRRRGRLDPAHARPRTARPTSRRCPARSCCSTSTSSPRATSSSPSAAPASAPTSALLAYSTDVVGDERYTVRVKDLDDRRAAGRRDRRRPRRVPPGTATGTDLYYTTVDDSWRADKIWRHRLGTAQADDELVYHEEDGRFWVGRRPHPQRPVPGHRLRLQDHDRVPLPRRRRPRRRLAGLRRAARGPGVRPRPRRHRRPRTSSWSCTTAPAPTSSSAPHPSRPRRRRTGRR